MSNSNIEIVNYVNDFINKQVECPWYITIKEIIINVISISLLFFAFTIVELVFVPVIRIVKFFEDIITNSNTKNKENENEAE